ncbi:MAG: GLUG motif-containing protein, partial [Oscillospiraceae bacterium]
MKKFKVYFFKKYNNYLIKHNLSKRVASKIITKATSLLLCVIMTFSMIIPMWNYIQFSSKAEELFFGQNTLDGSTGVGVDSWKNANDLRYILYPLGFVLGDEATPYIIKNANELYSFSQSMTDSNVNAANKWIDIQGLTQADIDILNTTNINKYLTTNVIDLRMFGGASLSATAAIYWNPIGTATNPFKGNIFSSTGVSIINLNYSVDMRKTNTTTTEYGLFGHFAGTVGLKGSPINLSAMKIATSDEVIKQTSKELDFSANSDILTSIGGFAAINTGTIKNVNFGVGKYYDITDSINPIKDNYNYDNSIIIPNSTNSSINVGGIVGKNSGIVENCNFDGKIISNGERIKYTVLNGNVTGFTKESNLPIKDDSNVGGIAGFSENKILNSVSNAKIDIFNAQKKVKLGGIVGNATVNMVSLNGEVLKCVFLGSINAKTPKTSNITGSDISFNDRILTPIKY